MKLSVIIQGGAQKDWIDLSGLVREHRPLPELLVCCRQEYGTEDIAHLLYALAYFDDADPKQMPVMLWAVDGTMIKDEIRRWVAAVAR